MDRSIREAVLKNRIDRLQDILDGLYDVIGSSDIGLDNKGLEKLKDSAQAISNKLDDTINILSSIKAKNPKTLLDEANVIVTKMRELEIKLEEAVYEANEYSDNEEYSGRVDELEEEIDEVYSDFERVVLSISKITDGIEFTKCVEVVGPILYDKVTESAGEVCLDFYMDFDKYYIAIAKTIVLSAYIAKLSLYSTNPQFNR